MSNWENYILEGTELPILTYPHPTLSKVAKPVTVFDDSLRAMIKDMIFTMYKAPGIGLAAPQVGKSVRLFVVDIDYDRDEITLPDGTEDYTLSNLHPLVFINPVFKDAEGEVIPVENDVTYLQLLDILHETFQVDREVYELKLEVPYVCGEQPFAPVQLKNDRQVRVFLGICLK